MEFNNIYIPYDIINIIYKNLNKFKDKRSFTEVNKCMLKYYYKKTQMYSLEIYVNKDYIRFYNLINKYDYEKEDLEYLKKICFETMKHLNLHYCIYLDDIHGFGDYRFIFELLYKYDIINKYMFKQNSPHFYKHFYPFMEKSIIKNERKQTIENINNSEMLYSLKRKFIPNSKKNNIEWVYLFE